MKLPWVSRRAYELAIQVVNDLQAVYERDRESWFAGSKALSDEIAKEREANRNLMASALALRNLGNPYRPANMTEPAKPIGKTTAAKMILDLEKKDREVAAELATTNRKGNDVDAVSVTH